MLQPLLRRTWAPRGQTPIMKAWDRHDRLTAIAGLSLTPKRRRCELYFELLPHNAKAEDFIAFLINLRAEIRRPLTIIWDRLSAHRKAARFFTELGCPWIRFIYLPAYCPDVNPVEHIWATTKWGQLSNWPAPDIESVGERVSFDFTRQSANQALLRGHFRQAGLKLK